MLNDLGINIRKNYHSDLSMEAIQRSFKETTHAENPDFIVRTGNNKVFVSFRNHLKKWWSPELTLTLDEGSDNTQIRELLGPHPATFTMTMFFLTGGVVIFGLAIMLAISQISLGLSASLSFITALVAIIFMAGVYIFLLTGRIRGSSQMDQLHQFWVNQLPSKPSLQE